TLPEVDIDGDQPALIMYTSGTTGNPRGVVHSYASVYSAIIGNISTFSFTEQDVVSGILPLFHCGAARDRRRRLHGAGPGLPAGASHRQYRQRAAFRAGGTADDVRGHPGRRQGRDGGLLVVAFVHLRHGANAAPASEQDRGNAL